ECVSSDVTLPLEAGSSGIFPLDALRKTASYPRTILHRVKPVDSRRWQAVLRNHRGTRRMDGGQKIVIGIVGNFRLAHPKASWNIWPHGGDFAARGRIFKRAAHRELPGRHPHVFQFIDRV